LLIDLAHRLTYLLLSSPFSSTSNTLPCLQIPFPRVSSAQLLALPPCSLHSPIPHTRAHIVPTSSRLIHLVSFCLPPVVFPSPFALAIGIPHPSQIIVRTRTQGTVHCSLSVSPRFTSILLLLLFPLFATRHNLEDARWLRPSFRSNTRISTVLSFVDGVVVGGRVP